MPTAEERTWTLVPEAEPSTPATTEPPGFTDLTWAQDDLAVPGSQRSLRQHRRKNQTGTPSCEGLSKGWGVEGDIHFVCDIITQPMH